MKYVARYGLLLAAFMCMAYYMPPLYKMTFKEFASNPSVYYSAVIDDFVYVEMVKNSSVKYTDRAGNEYTRKEFSGLLPFLYYSNLVRWGEYPNFIASKYLPLEVVSKSVFFRRIAPKRVDILRNRVKLYPLYESSGEFSKLEMPDELFRLADSMEFIQGEDLSVDKDKSELFTSELRKAGFTFPAVYIGGETSSKKPYDFGYFILDSAGEVFHMRQVDGRPVVKNTNLPEGINIDYISVDEDRNDPYYGLFITDEGTSYLLSKDNYEYVRIPVRNVNLAEEYLQIYGDPLNYMVKVRDKDTTLTYIFDKNWNLYKQNELKSKDYYSDAVLAGFDALFPFVLLTQEPKGFKEHLHFKLSENPAYAFILSAILAAAYLGFRFYRKKNMKLSLCDAVFILAGGAIPFVLLLLMASERKR